MHALIYSEVYGDEHASTMRQIDAAEYGYRRAPAYRLGALRNGSRHVRLQK